MDGLIPQTLFDWIESSAGRAVLSTVQGKAQLPSDTVYRIHDVYDHEDVPDALIDKHKVLQILVNLLSNAKDALRDANKERKDLTLRIRREGDDRVRIDVVDNGIGISGDTLTRLFAHGFSTKEGGHGFGLHSSALAAAELGGTLKASSDGPRRGATFTLELPLKPTEVLR